MCPPMTGDGFGIDLYNPCKYWGLKYIHPRAHVLFLKRKVDDGQKRVRSRFATSHQVGGGIAHVKWHAKECGA